MRYLIALTVIILAGCSPPPEQPELQSYANNPFCIFGCSTTNIQDSDAPTVSTTTSRTGG